MTEWKEVDEEAPDTGKRQYSATQWGIATGIALALGVTYTVFLPSFLGVVMLGTAGYTGYRTIKAR